MKSEASNADMNLTGTIIAKLTKENVIVDKKTCHGLDSFYFHHYERDECLTSSDKDFCHDQET